MPEGFLTRNDGTSLYFFGAGNTLLVDQMTDLNVLDLFLKKNQQAYLFVTLSYDLKNQIEKLESKHLDSVQYPDLICWNPDYVVEIQPDFSYEFLQGEFNDFSKEKLDKLRAKMQSEVEELPTLNFQARISKSEYVHKVNQIQQEIQQGNVYEMNFCQEFYAQDVPSFDPWNLFKRQYEFTKAPFSAYFQMDEFRVFCGSPERYIQKTGQKLISQPIKGTIRRGKDAAEDLVLKNTLLNDPKERSENVMIVDLVRNDLSRIAQKNSVEVDELFGVYTFETVHHLISTISCTLDASTPFSSILKASFPMGSMTGAPKISAMELTEKMESFKRGLYSGSIGYFKPNGDFDFNVVIRSFVQNLKTNRISCAVGSAITSQAIAENEYEECMVKVKRMVQLFGDDQRF